MQEYYFSLNVPYENARLTVPDYTRYGAFAETPLTGYIDTITSMIAEAEAINAKECYLGMKETMNNYNTEVERIYAACVAKSDNSSMENLYRLVTTLQANLVQLDQETYEKEQACVDETCRNTTLQDGLQKVEHMKNIYISKIHYLYFLSNFHYRVIVKNCYSFDTLDLLEDVHQRSYELRSCIDKHKS
uniref:Uncharacterized protein n=1 Tax=Clastoptera arizonana TaxID=38151 RepID=A0A1B6C2P1_9HEMI